MVFFVLIPICWITSILIYAASPRQQIDKQRQQAILTPSSAWIILSVINVACFIWLTWIGWSVLVALVTLLLLNMLLVPASIIFLAHRSDLLKPATISIVCVSLCAQLIMQGQ